MIPKTIHYCWFGRNAKPKLAEKCIKSWKKYCPDYEIIEWNEDNFDIASSPLYVRQAYEAKKWAFVTDYVRLKVIYDHGGIYLDTDVELLKNLDFLLSYDAYFGFEDGRYIATGLGFGAAQGVPVLKKMMDDYDNIPFVLPDGNFDLKPCPQRNTQVLLKYGLVQCDEKQLLMDNILILPSACLCPLSYKDRRNRKTAETISIHWYSASWLTEEQIAQRNKRMHEYRASESIDYVKHIPNRILKVILGKERYDVLKRKVKKQS